MRAVVDAVPLSGEPTLAEAGRALAKSLSLVPERDGSLVGGLEETRSGLRCAVRIHTPDPGIFAFDAWSLPPRRVAVEDARIEQVDRFAASLTAGALLLLPDGFVVHRCSCPYRWLAVAQLETPAAAYVALDGFMRWRAAT